MFNKNRLVKAVQLGLLTSTYLTAFATSSAFANDQPSTEDNQRAESTKEIERISVTGSRIQRTELDKNTPMFTFDADTLALHGVTNVADYLNQSPLFSGSQTPYGSQDEDNAGQNQINLFDLGTQRTLTLVNGKRFISSQSVSRHGGQVDMNAIPAGLIDRVETVPLTGAAIYGADAIAGTVNIILKDDYEGFELRAQKTQSEDGNLPGHQFSALSGANFSSGKGNITFGVEYTKESGLMRCAQDFLCIDNYSLDSSAKIKLDRDGDGQPDDLNQDGEINEADIVSAELVMQNRLLGLFTPYGSITPSGGFAPYLGHGAWPNGYYYEFTQDGSLVECQAGNRTNSLIMTQGDDVCGIDFFDHVSQIRSPLTRFNTYASFNYDFSDELRFDSDFVYANTKASELVNQGGFQTGFFGGTSAALRMPMSNPFLTEQAYQTLRNSGFEGDTFSLHRFNNDLVDLGRNNNETQVWRISAQLSGEFSLGSKDFHWDVSVIHGKSDIVVQTTGIVDGRFLNAIDARRIDDAMLEQIRLQDPEDSNDDLVDSAAALAALQGANGSDTVNFKTGDIICGAYADLAANTLEGFNSKASGNGLVDEDIPFLDGCVPLNLFGSQASQDAIDFISGGPRYATANNNQTIYSANIGGPLLALPAGYLDFVVGVEKRKEQGTFSPGMGLRVPITRSSISRPIQGGFNTDEYYFEFLAPLISPDMSIPLVQRLELTGAYRHQTFNTQAPKGYSDKSTEEDVYQLSLKWQVLDDLAIRATKATAFRNPSLEELFRPITKTYVTDEDPCDKRSVGLGPNPDVRKANCESIGIDTSTFVSKIQDGTIPNGLRTGNPDLTPELNESYSYGLVYTPRFIDGLSIAADYYNLVIEDYIENMSFARSAATCFDSNDFPNAEACSTFERDENHQVVSLIERPANVALSTFESVTVRAFYELPIKNWGLLSFDAFTQHNITNEFQATPSSEIQEDVGDYGDPKWNGTFDTKWQIDDFVFSHRLRWQGKGRIDAMQQILFAAHYEEVSPGVYSGNFVNETDAVYLHDLGMKYQINDGTSLQLNVKNLLDRKPDANGILSEAARHFGFDEKVGRRYSLSFKTQF